MFLPYTDMLSPVDVPPGSLFLRPEHGEMIRLQRAERYEDEDFVGDRVTGVFEETGEPYVEVVSEGLDLEVMTVRTEQWLVSDEAREIVSLPVIEAPVEAVPPAEAAPWWDSIAAGLAEAAATFTDALERTGSEQLHRICSGDPEQATPPALTETTAADIVSGLHTLAAMYYTAVSQIEWAAECYPDTSTPELRRVAEEISGAAKSLNDAARSACTPTVLAR